MNDLPPTDRPALAPLQVVMLFIAGTTVATSGLLLSAAESNIPVDGALPWSVQSPLRAIVQLLCLNYSFPTEHAGDVKNYILGIGAGLAAIALGIAVGVRPRLGRERSIPETNVQPISDPEGSGTMPHTGRRPFHLSPLAAAQMLGGMFLLWSLASSRWSAAPDLAIGASVLLTIQWLWAFCLGWSLSVSAARLATRLIIVATAMSAVVALWYYFGRNPTLRAKFPFGNPTILASCLIPGILLAVTSCCDSVERWIHTRSAHAVGSFLASTGVLVGTGWALWLSGSRGPMVGLGMGLLAVVFFASRRWLRWATVLVAIFAIAAGGLYFRAAAEHATRDGRDTTIRFRTYAWSYAWRMFEEKPFTGHGQGGFVLTGDSYAADDVLDDPLVFESRIAHAHSEWLETLADLGSVGFVLIAAVLLLTMRAGMLALNDPQRPGRRWSVIGLLGSLVALAVAEGLGVGLRVSGVPTVFFAIIGLLWALSVRNRPGMAVRLSQGPRRSVIAGVVIAAVGVVTLAVSHRDFSDSRRAYESMVHLQKGEYEKAVRLAGSVNNLLNPQRALENRYRLSEAYMLAAQELRERAMQREDRARQNGWNDPQRLALAEQDRLRSDEYCHAGAAQLKELIQRSPGFLNHGWVAYWLNFIQASNAQARNDQRQRQQFLAAALAAAGRELQRQPFDSSLALSYARVALGRAELATVIEVLARPLRYHPVDNPLLELLASLSRNPKFLSEFESIAAKARQAVLTGSATEPSDDDDALVAASGSAQRTWASEILRLAGALRMLGGDDAGARADLEIAAMGYDHRTTGFDMGAAACHAELADAAFRANPLNPRFSLEEARHAALLTPDSQAGRALQRAVKQRMILYLLALGQEDEARQLLREIAPVVTTEADMTRHLAAVYLDLSKSLMTTQNAGEASGKPQEDLNPLVNHLLYRARSIDPENPDPPFLLAQLSLRNRDCLKAVDHLRMAIQLGLPREPVEQVVQGAHLHGLDCPELNQLVNMLPRARDGSAPQPSQNPPPRQTPATAAPHDERAVPNDKQ